MAFCNPKCYVRLRNVVLYRVMLQKFGPFCNNITVASKQSMLGVLNFLDANLYLIIQFSLFLILYKLRPINWHSNKAWISEQTLIDCQTCKILQNSYLLQNSFCFETLLL